MRLDRRDFLRFSAGAVAGTAAGGITARGMSSLSEATTRLERPPAGHEEWIPTICEGCAGGCGIRVRVVGGRAVKIEGNPLFPLNRGGLCAKGQAGLQLLYHPDRVRTAMVRTGDRGTGQLTPAPWEDAIASVTERLSSIRTGTGPHAVAVVLGTRVNGLMQRLWGRFASAYGSPNLIKAPSEASSADRALAMTQGVHGSVAYDFENVRHIVSFGAPLLEGYGAPGWLLRTYGKWRDPKSRTRLVQIDSRLSVTAAKADEWVPVRPGTEGLLALGMAYVIFRERLYNEAFTQRHTFGLEDWADADGKPHAGFRNVVLQDYPLERVASQTGVPTERILKLAREFAAAASPLALGDLASAPAQAAVHSLNALVGSIDAPGGSLVRPEMPETPWDPVAHDAAAQTGLRAAGVDGAGAAPSLYDDVAGFVDAVLGTSTYPIEAVLLQDPAPLFQSSIGGRLQEALQHIPFVVTTSSFPDASLAWADVVLPNHTYLERWQDLPSPPTVPFSLYGLRQPVVPPVHDTRNSGDVLLEITRQLGGPVSAAFPWEGFEEVLQADVRHLFDLRRGNVIMAEEEEAWNRLLERTGWWAPSYQTAAELWDQLVARGGWWDDRYVYGEWGRVFRTPSGRFEFYSQTLAETSRSDPEAGDDARRNRLDLAAMGDRGMMPRASFSEPNRSGYPLELNLFQLLAFSQGSGATQSLLQESLAPHLLNPWKAWAEIAPETAHKLGIANGDPIWVESPGGRIRVTARLFTGALPNVVNIPVGIEEVKATKDGESRESDPWSLLEMASGTRTGWTDVPATRVRAYKA